MNVTIKDAREYLKIETETERMRKNSCVKLKRLEVPKFKGDPKQFYKWKSIFDRYTKECDDNGKYDYLLEATEGESRRYVETRNTYDDAMEKLKQKF